MTEAEWLEAEKPRPLVECLLPLGSDLVKRGSDRKLRLFGVACCHLFDSVLATEWMQEGVRSAEAFVDGRATRAEVLGALRVVQTESQGNWDCCVQAVCGALRNGFVAAHAALGAVEVIIEVEGTTSREFHQFGAGFRAGSDPVADTVAFLRDIFGNPFRPMAFDPEWRSDTAIQLAKHIYEDRDFAQMPILADALQDAGCDNDAILTHCRDANGVHVRGCWVLEEVLGKK